MSAPIRILIADDHAPFRMLLWSLLRKFGAEVLECRDGQEALERYQSFAPDWVLMDIEMPGLDGISATRQILAASPQARVLILTQHDDLVSTSLSVTNPQTFTLSVWFNTATARGGRILGFGNSQSGTSTMFDRAVYMGDMAVHRLVPLSLLVTGTNLVDVFIRVNSDATLDVVYGCQSVYAHQPVPGLTGLMGARFGLGGRAGGLIETHTIDNFTLEFGSSNVTAWLEKMCRSVARGHPDTHQPWRDARQFLSGLVVHQAQQLMCSGCS